MYIVKTVIIQATSAKWVFTKKYILVNTHLTEVD